MAIKKWYERKRLTVKVRGHYAKFIEFRERLYKKACFIALKAHTGHTKSLLNRLDELGRKFDSRELQSAF